MNQKSSTRAEAMGKANRTTARSALAGVAVMVIALAALLGTTKPALATPMSSKVAASPSSSSAAASPQQCFYTFPNCSSSDPSVKFSIVSVGDTSGCTSQDTVNWGDNSSTTKTYPGGRDGSTLVTFNHTYTDGPQPYTITITGITLSGSCGTLTGDTLEFTLLYAAAPPAPTGEACVFDAPRISRGTIGHVGWGFRLPNGSWEFGANEGPGKRDISRTWAEAGSWNAMLASFTNGGPYGSSGYYKSLECVAVPAFNAAAAQQEVGNEQHQLYVLIFQDCESQAYNVLSKYGVNGLPNYILHPYPNSWYNDLTTSAGFGPPTSL